MVGKCSQSPCFRCTVHPEACNAIDSKVAAQVTIWHRNGTPHYVVSERASKMREGLVSQAVHPLRAFAKAFVSR